MFLYFYTFCMKQLVYNDTAIIKRAYGSTKAVYSSLFVYYYLMFDLTSDLYLKPYLCSLFSKASFPPSNISQTCSRIPWD